MIPQRRTDHGNRLVVKALITALVTYALVAMYPYIAGPNVPEIELYLYGGVALFALAAAFGTLVELIGFVSRFARHVRALSASNTLASSGWLDVRSARKAGLTAAKKGLFLGILEDKPLFLPNPVHGLTCAPARKGKTTSFVMPALVHDIGTSRLVTDMKGELAVQTAKLIAEKHGHRVAIANPGNQFDLENASYNSLQIILDDLEDAPEDAIADARSLALQLHPDPKGGARDPFWPNGTRKILTFVFTALASLRDEAEANLPRAFEVLTDPELLEELILEAKDSFVLGGELARLAADLEALRRGNDKHFESFREGAVQSLAAFGPSGRLAASTRSCDFRFRDLKREKMTIFMVADPSRMDVFAPWIGVLTWAARKELIREQNDIPVQLILDEFTNYVLEGLPDALTGLGGFGIRVWMIVQELEEIARVYGREALATILSQSDAKQFFGVGSYETAKRVSELLGQTTIPVEQFGMGVEIGEMPSTSISQTTRDLLNPDEVRRLPNDEQILIIGNLKAIKAIKVGYQEVTPWRTQVAPNPLHGGGEPFIGEEKMRLVSGRFKATRAGTRKTPRDNKKLRLALSAIALDLVPGPLMACLLVGSIVIWSFGSPHLRIQYSFTGSYARPNYTWCEYYGLPVIGERFELIAPGDCPVIYWKR